MASVPFWFLGFLLLAPGLYFGVRGLLEERVRRRLRQGGTATKAVVTGHRVLRTGRGWPLYYVTYRYYYQGQRYEKAERVSSDRSTVWLKGRLISIRYLAQQPQVARIINEGNQFLPLGKVLIGAGLFFLAVAVVFLLTL